MEPKKILLYNWAAFDNPSFDGGGVTVYLSRLLQSLSESGRYECYFLSSGSQYTFDGKTRVIETENRFSPKVKSFQILNSPIHAPAALQAGNLENYLDDTSLLTLLESFWQEHGGFDVVHFHNLEGLSLPVLKLKESHPNTRFFLSLHNYMLFCPQVNLWTSTGENCYRNPRFPNCESCVSAPDARIETLFSQCKHLIKDEWKHGIFYSYLKRMANSIRALSSTQAEASHGCGNTCFVRYREENVRFVNMYIDEVFAVSKRTAEIAVNMGLDSSKVCTMYIGTEAAEHPQLPEKKPGDPINIVYLGYARPDKGFDFLLRAMEEIPPAVARRIRFMLYAKCKDAATYQYYQNALAPLTGRFHSISFCNGYIREAQTAILAQADLGILPVMWEDNLPQVAIEMIAAGVPILASDLGGAKELITDSFFVFTAGDIASFNEKLCQIVRTPEKLDQFWKKPVTLTKISQHIEALGNHYQDKERSGECL